MACENPDREEHISGSTDRVFGLLMAVLFAIVGLWPLVKEGSVRYWALFLSVGLLFFSILFPKALSGLNRLWMRLGLLLNRIISPLALGIIFCLAVLPIGLLLRLLGKDPLRLKFDSAADTYWIVREPPGPDPQTLKNQF